MIFASVAEPAAAGIPEAVQKLRYLRSVAPAFDPPMPETAVVARPVTVQAPSAPVFQVMPKSVPEARTRRSRRLVLASTLAVMALSFFVLSQSASPVAAKAAPPRVPVVVSPVIAIAKPVSAPPTVAPPIAPQPPLDKIWAVEEKPAYTVYSNGLQIRADYLTSGSPRRYRVHSRDRFEISETRSVPAGIVFHTTESLLLPLEQERNRSLVLTREELLNHIRNQRCYNFVIDRFGQVFRVVPEDQVAFHAGHSIWADDRDIFTGLNESFIGVSFEARTETSFEPTAAQIRSGRMLTDLLRVRFSIPESNCVTHAQVSVNPDNMRIGYHTDWAASFPFREMGLSSGYATPLASIEIFGFRYDNTFLKAIGGSPWEGLTAAEDRVREHGNARGLDAAAYRDQLQLRYRQLRSHANDQTSNSDRT